LARSTVHAVEVFGRIVFIVPAQLGDVMLCTPAIHAARLRWPVARIAVLGFAGTLALLEGNPDVDERIEIEPSPTSNWQTKLHEAWRLWRRYDLALVTRTGDRAHLAGWLAAGRRSALLPGEGSPASPWKRRLAQHGFVEVAGTPAVLSALRLLGPWLDPPAALSVQPPPPSALPPALEARLRHPYVVVHVPSMWRYKQWPVVHFRQVVQGLVADGVQVLLTGGASANDQALVAEARGAGAEPDLIDVSGQLDLRQVRCLLGRADAYLGPDTSVTHLAAAVGVPVVALFGPSQPENFGPWPNGHAPTQPWQRRAQRQQVRNLVVLQGPDRPDRPQCVPCNRMGCSQSADSRSDCLEGLAPQRVLDELRRVLRDAATRSQAPEAGLGLS